MKPLYDYSATPFCKFVRKPEREIDGESKVCFGKPYNGLPKCVNKIYNIFTGALGSVGGESGKGSPLYGELTPGSMHKILTHMEELMNLSCTSKFLDVGSGRGKPNLHASAYPRPCLSIGIEVDETRWKVKL